MKALYNPNTTHRKPFMKPSCNPHTSPIKLQQAFIKKSKRLQKTHKALIQPRETSFEVEWQRGLAKLEEMMTRMSQATGGFGI